MHLNLLLPILICRVKSRGYLSKKLISLFNLDEVPWESSNCCSCIRESSANRRIYKYYAGHKMRSLFNSGIMENVSIYTDIDRLQRLKIVPIFITNLACCHSNFNSIPVSFSGMPVFLSVMMIWLNTRRTKQAQVSTLIPVAAPKKPFAFCPTLFYLPLRGGITTTSQAWGQKKW